MDYDLICEKIQELIYQYSSIKLDYQAILLENGIDSVSIIELIINIEDEFNIEFEPGVLNYKLFKSINTISEHVYKILNEDQNND